MGRLSKTSAPTMASTPPPLLTPSSSFQQPQMRPTLNFSSSSNSTDLTSSLFNNINSLGSRSQTTSTGISMNTMGAKPSMPSPYFNSGTTSNATLFQPPPPAGSTIIRGSIAPSNTTPMKSASSELDDLFN